MVHLELRISPWIFEKIRNCPNDILRGWGKLMQEKNRSRKSRGTILLSNVRRPPSFASTVYVLQWGGSLRNLYTCTEKVKPGNKWCPRTVYPAFSSNVAFFYVRYLIYRMCSGALEIHYFTSTNLFYSLYVRRRNVLEEINAYLLSSNTEWSSHSGCV